MPAILHETDQAIRFSVIATEFESALQLRKRHVGNHVAEATRFH